MPEPRKTFAPVLGLGVAAGILTAVASNRPWVSMPVDDLPDPLGTIRDAGEMPVALAVSLVVLACWGVILVTRGIVRRVVAVLSLAASVGLVVTVVVGFVDLPEQVKRAADQVSPGGDTLPTSPTVWIWAAAVGAVLSLVATAAAVRWVGHWPEMGSRYDAPGTRPDTPDEDQTSLDLWKSIDEGRDPTV